MSFTFSIAAWRASSAETRPPPRRFAKVLAAGQSSRLSSLFPREVSKNRHVLWSTWDPSKNRVSTLQNCWHAGRPPYQNSIPLLFVRTVSWLQSLPCCKASARLKGNKRTKNTDTEVIARKLQNWKKHGRCTWDNWQRHEFFKELRSLRTPCCAHFSREKMLDENCASNENPVRLAAVEILYNSFFFFFTAIKRIRF